MMIFVPSEQLEGVELRPGDYSYKFVYDKNKYKYNYALIQDPDNSKSNLLGYATQGFETFSFGGKALEDLRGEKAELRFELKENTGTSPV